MSKPFASATGAWSGKDLELGVCAQVGQSKKDDPVGTRVP